MGIGFWRLGGWAAGVFLFGFFSSDALVCL